MSEASRPGSTTTPSPSPDTAISTEMVSSRSVPVSRSRSPVSSTRTPESTGNEVPRPAGRAARRCPECLDEDIALASELHARTGSLSTVVGDVRSNKGVVVGAVDWG